MSSPNFRLRVAFEASPSFDWYDQVIAAGPAAFWRLGEDAGSTSVADSSGNGNTGTPSTVTLGVAGLLGDDDDTAASMNGGDWIDVADSASLDVGDEFTLLARINMPAIGGSNRCVLDKGSGAYKLNVYATTGLFGLERPGFAIIVKSTVRIDDGEDHTIGVTKSGSDVHLYLDGVDVTGTVTNSTCANNATAPVIGANSVHTETMNCNALDEVAIFPTALSPATMLALHRAADPWTDITSAMNQFRVTRGRQQELDRMDVGTLAVGLIDLERRFDPLHSGSDLYPNVLPMRRIKLEAVHNGTTYDLFHGFVDAWPQAWQGPNVGFVAVTATDGFKVLARADVGEGDTWPEEKSGARINRILDAAGWPSTKRDIDDGYSLIAETTIPLGSGTTALATIQDTADAELGIFFFDGRGFACFHDRHHRRQAAYLTSQATFTDGNTAGIAYEDVALNSDPDRIWNDIQVTAQGEVQRVQDTDSQDTYGFRNTLARQVPLARGTEAYDQADYLRTQYKDPRYRLSGIKLTGRDDTTWAQVFGRKIADHVTVKKWPLRVGSEIQQECSIESLELQWRAQDDRNIVAIWMVSTVAYSAVEWCLLDDATYGLLDSTAVLVY